MKIALYVHDLKLEIGHSNSLIELIRHLPEEQLRSIEAVEIVSFTTTDPDILFPMLKGRIRFVEVPFKGMKPVLLKSIFFQLWTYLYDTVFQAGEFLRIGIGISSLNVDAVSVQFIHHQWTKRGLEMESGHGIRKFYKHLLFRYFEFCERFLFSRPGIKVFSPAQFLTEFLKKLNPGLNAATIYSGVNLDRFKLIESSKKDVLDSLLPNYPQLERLDLDKPIYLFVGAYERKGLPRALQLVARKGGDRPQFIVIGSPSLGRSVRWPKTLDVFPITFTREVPKFYALSDAFIFPTLYEPFGLVIFEAMAMGLTVVTRREEVGASELMDGMPEVYFCDADSFTLPDVKIKSVAERKQIRDQRLSQLDDVSWYKAGKELSKFLFSGSGKVAVTPEPTSEEGEKSLPV